MRNSRIQPLPRDEHVRVSGVQSDAIVNGAGLRQPLAELGGAIAVVQPHGGVVLIFDLEVDDLATLAAHRREQQDRVGDRVQAGDQTMLGAVAVEVANGQLAQSDVVGMTEPASVG